MNKTILHVIWASVFTAFGVLLLILPACSSDSEDEIAPECDLNNVTYTENIAPIMQQYCNSCHSVASPSAGVITANHAGLQEIALDGRLAGSVNHEDGYSPMPQGQPQLADCLRNQIEVWVNDGAADD